MYLSGKILTDVSTNMYTAYVSSDSSMIEINPVLKTHDDKIIAVLISQISVLKFFHNTASTIHHKNIANRRAGSFLGGERCGGEESRRTATRGATTGEVRS